MIVKISSDAELDVIEGYRFYERQADGLGSYFRDCIVADIESLSSHGGIHQISYGYHRLLAKRFPFAIYYQRDGAPLLWSQWLTQEGAHLGYKID